MRNTFRQGQHKEVHGLKSVWLTLDFPIEGKEMLGKKLNVLIDIKEFAKAMNAQP